MCSNAKKYILQKTREVIIQRCLDFGIDLKCQNDVALIIDGSTLDFALSCDIRMDFLELCSACKVVICCRVSPIQKAEVTFYLATFYDEIRSIGCIAKLLPGGRFNYEQQESRDPRDRGWC